MNFDIHLRATLKCHKDTFCHCDVSLSHVNDTMRGWSSVTVSHRCPISVPLVSAVRLVGVLYCLEVRKCCRIGVPQVSYKCAPMSLECAAGVAWVLYQCSISVA